MFLIMKTKNELKEKLTLFYTTGNNCFYLCRYFTFKSLFFLLLIRVSLFLNCTKIHFFLFENCTTAPQVNTSYTDAPGNVGSVMSILVVYRNRRGHFNILFPGVQISRQFFALCKNVL